MAEQPSVRELIAALEDLRGDVQSARATATLAVEKLIGLSNEFNDFRQDLLFYRGVRSELEVHELESQLVNVAKKLDTLKSNSTTDERIQKAVETAVLKSAIDWRSVKQTAVQAVAGMLAVALTSGLLWLIVYGFTHGK